MSLRLKDTIVANSSSATALETLRTINGTNFDGSANIVTSYWGTTRTLTIGSTGKSVNGSGNVNWSLSEIGAAAIVHTHESLTISDIRDTAPTPDQMLGRSITSFFNNHSSYGGNWQSGFTVNGWTSGYAAWQMRSYSSNGSSDNKWYLRSGNGATWGDWYEIYHTGSKPNASDVGLGNVNNWGASSSIAANSTAQYATTNMVAQVRAEKANTSHSHSEYLPLTGGSVSGATTFSQVLKAYRYSTNTNSAAITIDKMGSGSFGIGANGQNMTIRYGVVSNMDGAWNDIYDLKHKFFRGDLETKSVTVGEDKVRMEYNSTTDSIDFIFN